MEYLQDSNNIDVTDASTPNTFACGGAVSDTILNAMKRDNAGGTTGYYVIEVGGATNILQRVK